MSRGRRTVQAAMMPATASLIALVIGGLVIAATGVNPLRAYEALVVGALGDSDAVANTLTRATPLIFLGLGVALALRTGFWNLGGEGQAVLGALAATWVALQLEGIPGPIAVTAAIFAGFVAGAIWVGIPGVLKVYRGTNEIITTILTNFIALGIFSWFLFGPLKDPSGFFPQSEAIPEAVRLPKLGLFASVELGFWLAILVAVAMGLFLYRTVAGYEIRAVGAGRRAAEYAAMPVRRRILVAVLFGGGLAGIAGGTEVLGVKFALQEPFLPGIGFIGVAVALLGRLEPVGIVVAGLFIGVLTTGGDAMEARTGSSSVVVLAIQGLAILLVIVGPELRGSYLKSLYHRLKPWGLTPSGLRRG